MYCAASDDCSAQSCTFPTSQRTLDPNMVLLCVMCIAFSVSLRGGGIEWMPLHIAVLWLLCAASAWHFENENDAFWIRVCPETSGWIAEFSEHEAD